jgi:ribosome-binding ATPase YchF (GTP1/OBG family)
MMLLNLNIYDLNILQKRLKNWKKKEQKQKAKQKWLKMAIKIYMEILKHLNNIGGNRS